MKLARTPQKPQPETIIPLIDVVFFLLVFFMLIGRMDATAPFDVTPASARTGSDMPGGGLTISISRDGQLAIDGKTTDQPGVLVAVQERLNENAATLIRLNAHHGADLAFVLPLAAELENRGARDVVLVVTPEMP